MDDDKEAKAADDGPIHDEVEIEDFEYDEETEVFTYPCPCGDLFTVTKGELLSGEALARCPSCSLTVQVIYNVDDIENLCATKSTSAAMNTKVALKQK